ncbi:hypothetical protein ACJ5H2_02630 [Nocardioides sp. R1-1]|uniref:hypothetical protein n=1 Tax=Nocardioides sp. R1-1 TaxID=3383502 RepID=UPI0038D1F51C
MFGGGDDGRSFWFDATPLVERRSSGVAGRLLPRSGGSIEEFAHANDLDYDPGVKGDLPSLLIGAQSVCKDVVATRGEPKVEFGNHGWRYWKGSDDLVPSRQGYIAVQHGRALPHVLVSFAGAVGAMTPLNLASAAITAVGQLNFEDVTDSDGSPFEKFRTKGTRVELPAGAEVTAHTEKGREGEAQELLSGETLAALADLARSFTVEVREGWLLAYSHYGDVSTRDPEVWAWVFSVASRMLDLAQLWRETHPAAAGEYVAAGFDERAVPFYTDQRVERPSKLDGSLRFLKRSR